MNIKKQLKDIQTNLASPNIATTYTMKGKLADIETITADLSLGDPDLVAGKIKAGVTIFGVTGTYETVLTGDSVVANVLAGKTFYKDSSTTKLTGTMPNSSGDLNPLATDVTIPAGYHDGTGKVKTDANLIASNIKDGVTIFGVLGTYVP